MLNLTKDDIQGLIGDYELVEECHPGLKLFRLKKWLKGLFSFSRDKEADTIPF